MHSRIWLTFMLGLVAASVVPITSTGGVAQDEELRKLAGTWLFVEDRTEGRPIDQGGPPMSVRFSLRVEKDAVIYPRSNEEERITLDGTVIEQELEGGSIKHGSGQWKKNDGRLEYTVESVRMGYPQPLYIFKRVFCPTADGGLLVHVSSDKSSEQVAYYRHPEDIKLPAPAKATIADLAWLADNWIGTMPTSSVEERWSPPKGGAMLGVSRTIRKEKMTGFEFLRIVERDGGLVYLAQPGGRSPTEFVLTELVNQRAVFVNPRHDYPQRIVYELSDGKSLTTSIGFAKGRLQSFELTRESE